MTEYTLHDKKLYEGCENVKIQCYVQTPSKELNMPPRPAVVIFPGGGYFFTSDREAAPVASAYLAAGYTAFVVRYSVNECAKYPNALLDAAAAIKFVRDRAQEFNIDKDKTAVCGFSAGGHLAALISTRWNSPEVINALGGDPEYYRPNATILGYPVIDGVNGGHAASFTPLLGENPTKEALESVSPNYFVDDRTPPAFIWHTSEDSCVPVRNSFIYAQALAAHNVIFELHVLPKGVHGMSTATREVAWNGDIERVNPYIGRWVGWSVKFMENLFYGGTFRQ